MATTVIYNNVRIENCQTREFGQEIVYDPSGTDVLCVRYRLAVEGYIHVQQSAAATHGIQAPGLPLAEPLSFHFDRVSALLGEARKPLAVYWEGYQVLLARPAESGSAQPTVNTDVNNGPHPRGLDVVQVTPAAIKVRWSVETSVSGCAGNGLARKAPQKIINNRWSVSETRDSDFYTTRRIAGTIRFAEGLSPKHALADAVVPGLEKGFRRESFEYEVSPNGLEASYAIVDKQVHHAAPWPATQMDVTHNYSTNDALTWVDEVNVTLRGSPEADRRLLLQRMLQIIDQRVDALQKVQESDKQYLLENVVITEHLGAENVVSAIVAVKQMNSGARIHLGNILESKLGKPLELPPLGGVVYDRTISRTPAIHGYDPQGKERSPAFLFLLTCYYQDPCSPRKEIFGQSAQPAPAAQQKAETLVPYPVQVPSGTLPPGDQQQYAPQHTQAMYTFARVRTRYVTDRLRIVVPKAGQESGEATKDTAEMVELGAGITRRIVYYDAERLGDWPEIPDMPETYKADQVEAHLLKWTVEPRPPELSVDGRKRIYRVRAKAVYGLTRVPHTKLAVGVLPHTKFKSEETAFPFESAQTKRLGPN